MIVYGVVRPEGGWPEKPAYSEETVAKITARKNGFYRVKRWDVWTIAEWDDGEWDLAGSDVSYEDNDFQEINETLISPIP